MRVTRRQIFNTLLGIGAFGALRLALPEGQTAITHLRAALFALMRGRSADEWPKQIFVSREFYTQLGKELVPHYRRLYFEPNSTPTDEFLMFKGSKVRVLPVLRGADIAMG